MSAEKPCAHDAVYWQLEGAQEKGWRCLVCRARLGFRPDLDRQYITEKTEAVLHGLHEAGITYVSNSTEGYALVRGVAEFCRSVNVYDQQSIAYFLLDEQERTHFWREEARRWLKEHEVQKS